MLRWLLCGALVLGAHGTVAAVLATWSEPLAPGEAAAAIMIELAPMEAAPTTEKTDIPVGPQETQNQPDPTNEPVEQKEPEKEPEPQVAEQPPIPEVAPTPPQKDVAVELPPEKPKPKPKPQPKKMALATAPAAADRIAPRAVDADARRRRAQSQRNGKLEGPCCGAPAAPQALSRPARSRGGRKASCRWLSPSTGMVACSRAVFRTARVISELDQETLALVQRAQPFPDPPPDMSGQQFPFVVPLRYNLR